MTNTKRWWIHTNLEEFKGQIVDGQQDGWYDLVHRVHCINEWFESSFFLQKAQKWEGQWNVEMSISKT